MFRKVGDKHDLVVYGLADGSYKLGDSSIGGDLVVLGHRSSLVGVPIYWKSKTLKTVCTSAKAAETCSMSRLLDDVQFFQIQLHQLLFNKDVSKQIPIKIFSDSKPLLESIGSIHQVDEKLLRNNIQIMKNVLYDGIVFSFSWLESGEMLADVFTKEVLYNDDLVQLIKNNVFRQAQNKDNMVVCVSGEIKFLNRCDRKK
jgi:hypothetical protein